jgi:excisionase family DNA binding protein
LIDEEVMREVMRRVVREELAAAQGGWLNSKEAAEYLGISLPSLHNAVSDGRLQRHGEKGHGLRFRRSDLDAYVATRRRR